MHHRNYCAPTKYPFTVNTPLHFKCTWYRTVHTGSNDSLLLLPDTSSSIALVRISEREIIL